MNRGFARNLRSLITHLTAFLLGGLLCVSEDWGKGERPTPTAAIPDRTPAPATSQSLPSLIDAANVSISFVGPDLINTHVAQSLVRAHSRGVDLRVTVANELNNTVTSLRFAGVDVEVDSSIADEETRVVIDGIEVSFPR